MKLENKEYRAIRKRIPNLRTKVVYGITNFDLPTKLLDRFENKAELKAFARKLTQLCFKKPSLSRVLSYEWQETTRGFELFVSEIVCVGASNENEYFIERAVFEDFKK